MSDYEKQVHAIGVHNDEEIRSLERTGVEILSSVVPGSNLHEKIHNPVDSGIDAGCPATARDPMRREARPTRNDDARPWPGIVVYEEFRSPAESDGGKTLNRL